MKYCLYLKKIGLKIREEFIRKRLEDRQTAESFDVEQAADEIM